MAVTITERWADFLATFSFNDIPPEVVQQTKLYILDNIGCALGGYAIEWGKKVTALGCDLGGKPDSDCHGLRFYRQERDLRVFVPT